MIAFLFAGLFFSYSQSSLVALFAVRRLHLGRRRRPHRADRRGRDRRARPRRRRCVRRRQGCGRLDATRHERPLTADRPDGEGVRAAPARRASASARSRRRARRVVEERRPADLFVSHTTPLTVAAELGVVGLVLYAALLARRREGAAARVPASSKPSGSRSRPSSLALFVHSLFYSGFFEDPVTWLVLGVTSSFLIAQAPAPAREAA